MRDPATTLLWEAMPSLDLVTWNEAVGAAGRGPWRLPTVSELMGFLSGLPADRDLSALTPAVAFWSSSHSPFAPSDRVRAVRCEGERRFAVQLLSKSARARRWLVRADAPRDVEV